MASVPVHKIADHYRLTCGICDATYNNPKVLPCLHSFCQSCLDSNIRSQDRTISCPTCQRVVTVPAKGVEAFPLNFFVNNMLTVLAVQNPTKCTNCEDSAEASARCLDCVENLCSNCMYAHRRIRQTKEHRILSFEEIQANEVKDTIKCPSFCPTHLKELLKYFCETCDEAICRDCAIYEHREHLYVGLKEAVKKYRGAITSLLDNTKRKIPVVKAAVEEVEEVTNGLRGRVDVVKNSIHGAIQNHIRELEEQERDLMDRLEIIYRSKEKVNRRYSDRISHDNN